MVAHSTVLDRNADRRNRDERLERRRHGGAHRVRAGGRARPAVRGAPLRLQVFDLARLKARLGWSWPEQRGRAIAMIEAGLAREATPCDLRLYNGDARYFAVRAAGERRSAQRQSELLAADVTVRLCGTIPGGAIIRVATVPLDPAAALTGVATAAELLACLEALADGGDAAAHGPQAALPTGLQPRFRPILQLRKRLVSAYRLTAQATDGRSAVALEADLGEALDEWALREIIALLREPRRAGEPALVVPVHYATLASMRSRDFYSLRSRQLPRRSSRQVVFELLGLPEGLPQTRVRELLGYLRPFSAALLVRLSRPTAEIGHLASSGVRGLSLAAAPAAGDPADVDTLSTLAGRARVAGMRSMLVDLSAPALCRTAHAAGIDHVSGDTLMPSLTRPGRAFVVARGG